MMSMSPWTAEPVWLSPPRRQDTFAAAPTWMATSTLCSLGTSRTPAGSERSCRESPSGVWPKGMTRGRVGVKGTFGDDLGGLIFLFTRGDVLSFPYRSDSFQFIERERLRALMNLQSYRKDAGYNSRRTISFWKQEIRPYAVFARFSA